MIEVGLDYGFAHLKQDHDKLQQSKVVAPYLVQFSRIRVIDEPETVDLTLHPAHPIRACYVHHSLNGDVSWKHLNETAISTR